MNDAASPPNTGFFGVADGRFHFVAIGGVALVAALFQFGYPLVILLAVLASFIAIGLMVGLTALDLAHSKKPALHQEKPALGQAAVPHAANQRA